MKDATTITLGGQAFAVQPLTFGQLKRMLPAINRAGLALARGRLDDAAMDDMGLILAGATGLDQAALDALPMRVTELAPAFQTIVELAGLTEDAAGEAQPGPVNGTGTTSMPTLPPASAGPGTPSTE